MARYGDNISKTLPDFFSSGVYTGTEHVFNEIYLSKYDPIYPPDYGVSLMSNSAEYGWKFTVGYQDLLCTRLGCFVYLDGQTDITINLWRVSDGAKIATKIIGGGRSGEYISYLYAEIKGVILESGNSYIISMNVESGKNYLPLTGVGTHIIGDGVSFQECYKSANGTIGVFPTISTGTYTYGIATFSAISLNSSGQASGSFDSTQIDLTNVKKLEYAKIKGTIYCPSNCSIVLKYRIFDGTSWSGKYWKEYTTFNHDTWETMLSKITKTTGYKIQWFALISINDTSNIGDYWYEPRIDTLFLEVLSLGQRSISCGS